VGARGKKRIRANGQIASGRQQPMPRPHSVPAVEADQVRDGLGILRAAVAEKGASDVSSPGCQAAYRVAQERLHARHGRLLGDAILWRATFLDSLVGWSKFQELHRHDGELPTADMLDVAATIATYGEDTSFDIDVFEEHLSHRSR
jgi:hypothetical protein